MCIWKGGLSEGYRESFLMSSSYKGHPLERGKTGFPYHCKDSFQLWLSIASCVNLLNGWSRWGETSRRPLKENSNRNLVGICRVSNETLRSLMNSLPSLRLWEKPGARRSEAFLWRTREELPNYWGPHDHFRLHKANTGLDDDWLPVEDSAHHQNAIFRLFLFCLSPSFSRWAMQMRLSVKK